MNEELSKTLLGIIGMQATTTQSMTEIAAQLNALRLTIFALHPKAKAAYEKVLPQVRDKFAEEINRQQFSLELLKATVSTIQ